MDVKATVFKIIAEKAGVAESELKETTNLQTDLELDSMDIMELLMVLEGEFEIQIPDEDLDKIQTLKHIVAYIENNQ